MNSLQSDERTEELQLAAQSNDWPNGMPRLSSLACFLFAVAVIPAMVSTVSLWLDCHNDIPSWAAKGSPTRIDHARFVERFGNLETVAISWPEATITVESDQGQTAEREAPDPVFNLVEQFRSQLIENDQQGLFQEVRSSDQILEELIAAPLSLKRKDAINRLRGWAIGGDGKQACIGVEFSQKGVDNRRQAVVDIRQAANEIGITDEELKLAASGYWLSEIDRQSVASPCLVIPFVILLVAGLLRWSLRTWRLTFAILTVAIGASVITTSLVYWTGLQMNAVLSTLPTLVFLIGVSNCLHMANHMLSAPQADSLGAMRYAYQIAWKPTFYSGLTTSLGLLSLLASQTLPIRQFGIYGTLGMAIATMLALLVFPAFGSRRFWPGDSFSETQKRTPSAEQTLAWAVWNLTIWKYRKPISIVALLSLPLLAIGIFRMETSVQPDAFFRHNSDQLTDARWFEENFCGLDTFEVVIEFPNALVVIPSNLANESVTSSEPTSRTIDRFMVIQAIQERLSEIAGIEAAISATTFTPKMPSGGGFRAIAERGVVNDFLERNRAELLERRLLADDGTLESWRINLRVSSFADFDRLRKSVKETLTRHLSTESKRIGEEANWWLSGSGEMFFAVEKQFLSDLFRTYLTGFAVVSLTVALLLRSFVAGVLAMLPNILPAILVFGMVGFFGITLEVGSIMTASVALGIAVDDTLHYLAWTSRELASGTKPKSATWATFRHCGKAMTQTSLICGAGTGLLAFCSFLPTVRFGLLLTAMLVAALIADLIVLPAIVLLTPKVWSAAKKK